MLTSTPINGDEKTRYYSTNARGDIEALTNPDGGAIESSYRYFAYGSLDEDGTKGEDDPTQTENDPIAEPLNPYRYNAKRIDTATGNIDMGFRNYDPGLNTFLTRDMYNGALADMQLGVDPWNANRYAFAGGNPITRIELDGHKVTAGDYYGAPEPEQQPYYPAGSTAPGSGPSAASAAETSSAERGSPQSTLSAYTIGENSARWACDGDPVCLTQQAPPELYGIAAAINEAGIPEFVEHVANDPVMQFAGSTLQGEENYGCFMEGDKSACAVAGAGFVPIPIARVVAWANRARRAGKAANDVAPRFITTGTGNTIDRLAVNTSISAQRQGRHVLGARQYEGGSYFNSADDAQRVLDDFHSGAADVLGVKGNDIVVRSPNVTGTNVNPGAGYPSQATSVFFIKGSSSPSVVPYNPAWTP